MHHAPPLCHWPQFEAARNLTHRELQDLNEGNANNALLEARKATPLNICYDYRCVFFPRLVNFRALPPVRHPLHGALELTCRFLHS